jgi:O-antigen ligase
MLASQAGIEGKNSLFLFSAFMFRVGLATMTFDQIRPDGVLVADYFFFLSLLLLLFNRERRSLNSRGSGVLAASAVILCGALLSGGLRDGAGARIFVLFALFAPLAVAHSKNIRKNLLFLVAGVSFSCLVATLSAWISPGIAKIFAINPYWPTDLFQESERFGGLAGHPTILGLTSALALLIALGLLRLEAKAHLRYWLYLQILVCTLGGLVSGSRNFIASLIPGVLVLTLWRPWNRRVIVRVCIGLICLSMVLVSVTYLAPDLVASYTERLSKTSAEDTENSGRLLMAAVALTEIYQKPFWGWGMDRFGEAGTVYIPQDNQFMPAHNNFLQYWYAMGILGAIGYALLFILPVRRMLQTLRTNPSDDMVRALKLGISVYLLLFVGSNLQPILLNRFFYVPLFLFAGLVASVPDALRARVSTKGVGPTYRNREARA